MLPETHPKVVQHLPECQEPTLQGGTASAGMTGTVSTGISGTVWTGIFKKEHLPALNTLYRLANCKKPNTTTFNHLTINANILV
jgi:hypothetical protein